MPPSSAARGLLSFFTPFLFFLSFCIIPILVSYQILGYQGVTTSMSASRFNAFQIGTYVHKVVEGDPFGQYPFLYVVQGQDKVVLIDTGCPKSSQQPDGEEYREFVTKHLNPKKLPYLVVCTHVHFDMSIQHK
eukprot:g79939.t1